MTSWLQAGVTEAAELPPDQLNEGEQAELQRLMAMRDRLTEQLHYVEQRVELFLLSVRDRRGFRGLVQVNPHTGQVRIKEDAADGHDR